MNYLKELVSFHDWLDTNPLSSGTIALWHTLMAINNKTVWSDEFTVANLTLQAKCCLSRQQLDRSRTQLMNAGRIVYTKSGRANQAGCYALVRFDTQDDHKASTVRTRNEHDVTTLSKPKQNEIKQIVRQQQSLSDERIKSTREKSSAVVDAGFAEIANFYETNIAPLTPQIGQVLGEMCDELNSELALLALKKAVLTNATHKINYSFGIIRSWRSQNFTTITDAENDEKQKARKGQPKAKVRSLFDASSETLERQRKTVENYKPKEIDYSNLPF
ncbi:DnaD domain-containing protein [Sporosarcina aquimarina]|uniref:DnaD domain-containing protein n=1 Tax=Sporosarcina aquimarina TaxID=114975 RepID=UPI001C8E40F8|nr:DnaD domain protein [Sporosarcina aquimarina]MBY0223911.1 DnaD domain protein [Sporosarcina aquimarina]